MVGIYIGLYAITNNYCVVRTRNGFYLPTTLTPAVTWKLRLNYGDFVQANSKIADNTAGQLESALRINKASAKAFEPRVTWSYCILAKLS